MSSLPLSFLLHSSENIASVCLSGASEKIDEKGNVFFNFLNIVGCNCLLDSLECHPGQRCSAGEEVKSFLHHPDLFLLESNSVDDQLISARDIKSTWRKKANSRSRGGRIPAGSVLLIFEVRIL